MPQILTAALHAKRRSFESVDAFWKAHVEQNALHARPLDRAILGGALADRLGYAFAAGYAAALHALVPGLSASTVASVAATEEGGAHPRAIKTALIRDGGKYVLRGKKLWVTLAGEELLVLANAGQASAERAELKVVRVPRGRAGVKIVPLPEAPFIPEIAHAEVHLEGVAVEESEVQQGDGWNDWIRPFRTIEDIHVHAALLGHLVASEFPQPAKERMLAVLVALRALASENPSSAETHLVLAGCIAQTKAIVAELDWSKAPDDVRARWERDSPLLMVAAKAREARRLKAWETLAG